MLHTINCVSNAIKCTYENNAHATQTTTREFYEIANMYIDESIVTCVCNYERISIIENELRELYKFAHVYNFQIKSSYIEQFDIYHVAYSHTYDDNSIAFESMIVKFNDEKSFKTFHNFDMLNEIDLYN